MSRGDLSLFRSAPAFNSTVPANNGNASNRIVAYPSPSTGREITASWYADSPLAGVVQGCSTSCKLEIHAPALFPTTCTDHVVALDPYGAWDWKAYCECVMEDVLMKPRDGDFDAFTSGFSSVRSTLELRCLLVTCTLPVSRHLNSKDLRLRHIVSLC